MRAAAEQSGRLMRHAAERLADSFDAVPPMELGMEQMMRGWIGFFQRAALSQTRLMHDLLQLGATASALQAQFAFLGESLRNIAESTDEMIAASGRVAMPIASLMPGRHDRRLVEAMATDAMARAYRDHREAQWGPPGWEKDGIRSGNGARPHADA
jgi:hypothetical protein